MVTKKQLQEKVGDIEKRLAQLEKEQQVSTFLRNNPSGFLLSTPRRRGIDVFGYMTSPATFIKYVHDGELKTVVVCISFDLKRASVVRETEQIYIVRVDREWTHNGETTNKSEYYRVYKRTGDVLEELEEDWRVSAHD